jgi:hypothetical protein
LENEHIKAEAAGSKEETANHREKKSLKAKTGLDASIREPTAGGRGEERTDRWNSKNIAIRNWNDNDHLLIIEKKILVIVTTLVGNVFFLFSIPCYLQ